MSSNKSFRRYTILDCLYAKLQVIHFGRVSYSKSENDSKFCIYLVLILLNSSKGGVARFEF